MFGERLGMKFKVDNGSYDIIGAFTGEENENIEVICFLYDDGKHSIAAWYDGIQWRNEKTLKNWAISFQDIKEFINDENEKKIYTTKKIDGIVVKKPIIHSGLSVVEERTFWVESRSKIGRAIGEKIEIFI
ncbi:Oidioi.mRNA.OKI2018_I69.PAR.g11259.t1.cds [Oikopleura dioica]|uniref:Oidioi.mRNA.OKI2018_I69.PAR.g11259.t1.cds n=1 Tax=Oikopleura dioica TaxID=34765 RepID=A0ABN7RV96_OIKDI|nr:Oidioi.mRNA.OKI2018_I69.PAR.g11259.t1.cds [Oikopleura dioica]